VENWNNYVDHIKTIESAIWKVNENTSDDSTDEVTDCQHDSNGILWTGYGNRAGFTGVDNRSGGPRLDNRLPPWLLNKLLPDITAKNQNTAVCYKNEIHSERTRNRS
jgi:hypothetical protein